MCFVRSKYASVVFSESAALTCSNASSCSFVQCHTESCLVSAWSSSVMDAKLSVNLALYCAMQRNERISGAFCGLGLSRIARTFFESGLNPAAEKMKLKNSVSSLTHTFAHLLSVLRNEVCGVWHQEPCLCLT